jgi:AbrB family looped-hinge helix DNA binding protein
LKYRIVFFGLLRRTEEQMKEILASVTTKGQITIPAEIRHLLGVLPHDKVAFVVEDNQVRFARRGSVIEQTAGALRSSEPPLTSKELRQAAEEAIAEGVVERTER